MHFTFLTIDLNKYAYHTIHMCSNALLLYSIHRPHIAAHISKKKQFTIVVYHVIAKCANNKYAPQVPDIIDIYHICHVKI